MKKFQDFSKDFQISQRFLKDFQDFSKISKISQDFSKISGFPAGFQDFLRDFRKNVRDFWKWRTPREIVQLTCPEEVVELGSGTAMKTRPLLEAMRSIGCSRYVPLDISESALQLAAAKLATEYAWLHVDGFVGDFDADLPKNSKEGPSIGGNSWKHYR